MTSGARDAMIDSTIVLLRERGLTGTSVRDVIEHSGAPRGSIYHHFPGGKQQLVSEAVQRAGAAIGAAIGHFERSGDPVAALDALIDFFKDLLVQSDFNAGCPVAAVAGEADSTSDHMLSAAAGDAFISWRRQIAAGAAEQGLSPERAASLANLTLSAVEGALLIARATRSTRPLDDVAKELRLMIERELA